MNPQDGRNWPQAPDSGGSSGQQNTENPPGRTEPFADTPAAEPAAQTGAQAGAGLPAASGGIYPIGATAPQPMTSAHSSSKSIKPRLIGGLRLLINLATFVALVWLGVVLINHFAFQSYFVQGTSMQPTLQNNDRLLVSKFERTGAMLTSQPYLPARGQIVVLDSRASPFTAVQKEELVKRVIGLPGDTVTIDGGKVIIKNPSNPYGFNVDQALGLRLDPTYADQPLTVEVPAGQVFVLGDNRGPGGSYDSRSFGTVPVRYIEGRLWVRLFPFDRFHVFK